MRTLITTRSPRTRLVAAACIAAIVIACAHAAPAHASEVSSRLVSRGLIELHAGDYSRALGTFDKAVAADARDAEALYYRGVTYGRADRFDQAAEDLAQAIAIAPQRSRAKLELGYALFRLQRYDDARPLLEQAQADPALAPQASLFLGIIDVRQGRTDEGRVNLDRAATDARLAAAAHFYQGLAAQRAGRTQEAVESLQWTADHAPRTEMAREAERRAAQLGEEAESKRRYQLYGSLGFEYDSNVVLAPSDGALAAAVGIKDESDGRGVIEAGGRYEVIREPNLLVSGGVELFRSLHFELGDSDLQDHRAKVDASGRIGKAVVGLSSRYDYYLRDFASFLEEVSTAPWLRIPLGDLAEADLYYRFRYRDFIDRAFDAVRDAANHAAGVRVAHYFGARDRYVALGYRFDHEDPAHDAGELFAYDGHEGDVELGWTLPGAIAAELTYGYRSETYDRSASNGREDSEHLISVVLDRQLTTYLWLEAAYGGTLNNSNRDFFEYDRHVGSLALQLRY